MANKVTLSMKQVDGNTEQSSLNLSYVNPDATNKQLAAFAEQTLALSTDTLVSAQRVEYEDILTTKSESNLKMSVSSYSAEQSTEITASRANLGGTNSHVYFHYDGDGELYVKSLGAWIGVAPFQYSNLFGSAKGYTQLFVLSTGITPQYDNTYSDPDLSNRWVLNGDVVIGVKETDSNWGSEVVIHITD